MVSLFQTNFLKKLNNSWIFEYIVILIFLVLGGFGWVFSYRYFGFAVIMLAILLLFVFNDFKYLIPATFTIIFSYNIGYDSDKFPIEIAIYGGTLIGLVLLYSILNFKLSNFKKPKSFLGIMILAISCIIPIFWNKVITAESSMMYFLYFTWVLYIVLYFIFGINLGKNSLRVAIFTLSTLTALISFECAFHVITNYQENTNILAEAYYMGWGLCNEAGIMICFGLPFVFYELIKSESPIVSALGVVKVVIATLGVIFTNSRGAFLFGSIELILFLILMIVFSKKRITNIVFTLLVAGLAVLYIELNFGLIKFVEDIKEYIFYNGLDNNGRLELWTKAYELWNQDWLTRIFGSGIVSEIEVRGSFNGADSVFIVYHSTFFETLALGGGFGILALLWHFIEKYKQLWKTELAFGILMVVGYLAVDAYGMIDNTYGMYYYMIPLVLVMACLDNDRNTNIYKNIEIA